MTHKNLDFYHHYLQLSPKARWSKIQHNHAISSAQVYQIQQDHQENTILKIYPHEQAFENERLFLNTFKEKITIPKLIQAIPAQKNMLPAIYMQALAGDLLSEDTINPEIALSIGQSLGTIHSHTTTGYGYLNQKNQWQSDVQTYIQNKFNESINECAGYFHPETIKDIHHYFTKHRHNLEAVDGPCMIHRDFRPGNILIGDDKLSGIIDWASARSGFAEEDWYSIEQNEWQSIKMHWDCFLKGYQKIRPIPPYQTMMPILSVYRSTAILGFLIQRDTHLTTDQKLFQKHKRIIEHLIQKTLKEA